MGRFSKTRLLSPSIFLFCIFSFFPQAAISQTPSEGVDTIQDNDMGEAAAVSLEAHNSEDCGSAEHMEEEASEATCKKAAKDLARYSNWQKHSDTAGVSAVSALAIPEVISRRKKHSISSAIQKVGGVASIAAGAVDIYTGAAALSGASRNIEKQRKATCDKNSSDSACEALPKLNNKVKAASYYSFLKGTAKLGLGALSLQLSNRSKKEAKRLHSMPNPRRAESLGPSNTQKAAGFSIYTSPNQEATGAISSKASEVNHQAPSGGLSSYRKARSPAAGEKLSSPGTVAAGAKLLVSTDPYAEETSTENSMEESGEDFWLQGGTGIAVSPIGDGDGGFSKLLGIEKKVKFSPKAYARFPSSTHKAQARKDLSQTDTLFRRVSRTIDRLFSRGKISNSINNVDKL